MRKKIEIKLKIFTKINFLLCKFFFCKKKIMNLCIIFTGKILLLLIITTTSSVDSLLFNRFKGKSIDQLIYNRFESTKSDISFCIRRFNLTHSTGCSSKQDGNNGHPYQIFNHLDMENMVH